MQVSSRTVGRGYCCKYCYPEWGHSRNRSAKIKLKRLIKHRERQTFKREVRGYLNH